MSTKAQKDYMSTKAVQNDDCQCNDVGQCPTDQSCTSCVILNDWGGYDEFQCVNKKPPLDANKKQ